MDWDGGEAVEQRREADVFEIPTLLAKLDDQATDVQHEGVRTVRQHVDDHPGLCLPTVPKLRALLGASAIDCHDEIAYCLAELAAESPADVAPSTDEIVSFVGENPAAAATSHLFRCLALVAGEQPGALHDHVDVLTDAIDERAEYGTWERRILDVLSRETPAELVPAVPVLVDALVADPDARATVAATIGRIGAVTDAPADPTRERLRTLLEDEKADVRANACLALGNAGVIDARDRLDELAAEDPDPTVRERAAQASDRLS
ncbi:HEAT repeat domain-containing protein [Natrialbaceae archaeon A-arb3/5]